MIGSLLVAFLLSASAMAQTPAPAVMTQFLGMNDTDPSVALNPAEAQSALNVESGLSGLSIQKRPGYSRLQSLTIATSAVSGSYNFIDANGAQEQVVCQDHNCAKSVNGGAFSVFMSTAGGTCMPTRWSFAQQNGFLYGANDCRDAIFKYDGTTRSPLSASAPLAAVIELTKDRLVAADVSANPNGVYYSQSGTPSNFTVGLNSADPYVDVLGSQGDRVTALKYTLGRLFIFKTNSLTACILGDQYSSRCFPVSNTTGTGDPQSVVEVPGGFYFRGNDLNYWAFDGQELSIVSKKISNFIKTQNSGTTQSNTQTSQADWQAGTQYGPGTWNTVTTNGSIFPSSSAFIDSFSSGTVYTNIDTTTARGIMSISSITVQDSWTNGLVSGRLAWVANFGTWAIDQPVGGGVNYLRSSDSSVADLNSSITTSSVTISSGSWKINFLYTNPFGPGCSSVQASASPCFSFRYMVNAGGDYYELLLLEDSSGQTTSSNKTLQVNKNISGASTTILSTGVPSILSGIPYAFEIQRSSDGKIAVLFNNAFSTGTSYGDISLTSSTSLNLLASGNSSAPRLYFNGFYAYRYISTATYISREFDTGYSTPTWSPLSSTFTVTQNSEGQVVFYTQVSTSPNNDMYDAKVASSDTVKIASSAKRYIRYEADLVTFVSTKTPTISAVSLTAATTGQFVSQCIQPGAPITGWGLLSCAQTLSQGGSEVFYATSAVSCAALPTVPPLTSAGATQLGWTAQTNNSALSISTNAAVYIAWRSLLTSATDQAQVDACTLYWNNGVTAPPVWATFDSVRNAVYWTTAINNSATNNRVLKYDLNLNQWYPFSLNANAIRNINNQTYFGDSTGGFWNQYGGVTSDNGSAINSYWKSKDFGNATNPFLDNNYTKLSLVTKNQVTGNMTVTLTPSNGQSSSYTVSLATTSAQVYVHSNQNLPFMSPLQFMNVQFGNNSATPWEVDGAMLEMTSFPWKPQNP